MLRLAIQYFNTKSIQKNYMLVLLSLASKPTANDCLGYVLLLLTERGLFDGGECTGMQVLNDNLNRTNIENSLIGSRLAGPGMVVSVWL